MAFELPDLPYAHDALASKGMSAETLEYHHDLHHNAYVTNGNAAIAGTEWDGKSMEEIIKGTYDANAVAQNGIFNNISQLWNHNQFWEMMGPGDSAMPSELEAALVESFGSVDEFKSQFSAAGAGQFGSGWVWLAQDNATGKLEVMGTPNGENPVVHGKTPLLGCDVWEHSYYIDYRNARPKYLEAFVDSLINWEYVAELYEKGPLKIAA